MVTIIKGKTTDPKVIHETLQNGYGIEHPEKIAGYGAFFMNYGDICVSDRIAFRMDHNEEFRNFVMDSLRSFQKDDYGQISRNDYDENVESKWILGGGGEMFGRYPYTPPSTKNQPVPESIIKIRTYEHNTYILYDSEPDWLIREYLEAENQ